MSLLQIENHNHNISNHPNEQTKKDLILAKKLLTNYNVLPEKFTCLEV